jgi:hypothetical protein
VKPPTTRTLRRRGHGDLALQHRHRIGQAPDPIPAQLHIEVEPAADDVQVIVDESRQHAPAVQVYNLGLWSGQRHHGRIAADRYELAVRDRDGVGGRIGPVERGEEPAVHDQVGR